MARIFIGRFRTLPSGRSCIQYTAYRMSNRLQEILNQKQKEIARILPRMEHLKAAALQRDDFRGFGAAIDPGPGRPRPDRRGERRRLPWARSRNHLTRCGSRKPTRRPGRTRVSVLTDERFSRGTLSFMTKVRQSVSLPVLRKDFHFARRPDF